jgi:O-antigen/teichoic acid export membrane protein
MSDAPRSSLGMVWRPLLRIVKQPAFVYLAATLLNRVSAIVLIPIYTRRLSLAAYGDYALALTLTTVLSFALSLGLTSSVGRVYFDGVDRELALTRSGSVARWVTVLVLGSMATLAAVVVLAAPASGDGVLSRHAMLCVLAAAGGAALGPVPLVFLRAVQRPYLVALLQFVDLLASTGFGILFVVHLDRGFLGSVEAMAASGAVNIAIAAAFIWGTLRGRLDPQLLLSSIRFSAPFLLHAFANWVQSAGDRWGLKLTDRDADVGRFALAVQLTQPVGMPGSALADAEFARVGELFRVGGLSRIDRALGVARLRYLLVTLVPALLLVAALPLARILLGPAATGGTLRLVPLLCLVAIVDMQFFPSQLVVYYASRTRWMLFVTFATLLTNIGLMALLVPPFGTLGAIAARGGGSVARSTSMWLAARVCLEQALDKERRKEG